MPEERLSRYRAKRDTTRSGEPAGTGTAGTGRPIFVIQRHDASSLHFDLRLQVGDVLVSWAVPKGPSLDPRQKRLATRTEDHPLEYADFEGAIPEGQYGAGTVVVWDRGGYENLTTKDGKKNSESVPADAALEAGHLKVRLDGEKVTGAFALTRTDLEGDDRAWLLVKVDDSGADRRRRPTTAQPESVLSGRTNADLEDES